MITRRMTRPVRLVRCPRQRGSEHGRDPLLHYITRRLVRSYIQGYQVARVLGVSPLSQISVMQK